jgi:hypothetical protein
VNRPRPRKRRVHVRQHVFGAHVAVELRAIHERRGLGQGTTEQQRPAGRVQRIGEVLDCVQARGVERRHVTQAQDHDVAEPGDL